MARPETASERLVPALGVASVAVAFGGVVLSMVASPWFSPLEHALSDLGARGAGTAPLFNGALLVGGALGTGFAVGVAADVDDPVRRAGALFVLLSMGCMALVGAFPLPDPVHGLVAVPFFVFLTLGVALWGAGDCAAGRPLRGLVLVLAAALHVFSWLWWIYLPWLPPGIAVPELVGSAAVAGWAVWVARDGFRAERPGSERR